MPYTKTVWTNGVTPVDQTNQNHLETQYDEVATWVRKTADQTVNNSIVKVNDTHLKFAMLANEVWEYIFTPLTNSSAVADMSVSLTGPALSTIYQMGYALSGGTYILVGGATVDFDGAGADVMSGVLRGIVINGANAGDFQVTWAQKVAEASDTKMLTSSFIRAHKLA